ncbi:MAG: hypothetical protein M3R24_38545 [Chloroflexota bacterium]|nr:hypothetical protein [Chloroflexota bacterium]
MLPLDDPRWQTYEGGYRIRYDVSAALKRLFQHGATPELWDELWHQLHHQGDVGAASYAAVPYLLEYARHSDKLDWNSFGLISTIELARPHNPAVPEELADAYFTAIRTIPVVVGTHVDQDWDALATQTIVSCIALARGQRVLGRVYLQLSEDAAKQWLTGELGHEFE